MKKSWVIVPVFFEIANLMVYVADLIRICSLHNLTKCESLT
jgi:hypothetical protein